MEAENLEASQQPGLITLCTVMLTLATVAVVLRCWSVHVSPTQRFGYDDFFAVAKMVSNLYR